VTNVNITCPADSIAAGATTVLNGKYTWSADGSSGSGELSISLRNAAGQAQCQSSYDANAVRL
jgi:hypothetical protein